MIKHYLNPTNGLEWLDQYPDAGLVRIPSTYIEKNDWAGIFLELDSDLLFGQPAGFE